MTQLQFLGAVELGLIYGMVAIAVYLTFRVINFPDLTVDGSFPLGAAITAALISHDFNPYFATAMAFVGGGMAGFVTGYLNVRWKILGLLAGILTMSALYSVNLRIMGKPNIALLIEQTIFTKPTHIFPMLIAISVCVIILLTLFLRSQFGLAQRAIGINPKVCPAYGINLGWMTLVGLSLSNALAAFAGSLFTQVYGFADISMGTGTLIIGLASVIVGETLVHSSFLWVILSRCILGSILYRLVISLALNTDFVGLKASDLNLITSILVVFALLLPELRQKFFSKYRVKT